MFQNNLAEAFEEPEKKFDKHAPGPTFLNLAGHASLATLCVVAPPVAGGIILAMGEERLKKLKWI